MTSLETCSIEPFLYAAAPQGPSPADAAKAYWEAQGGEAGLLSGFVSMAAVPQQETAAVAAQTNDGSIEAYLNRLREALCADLTALEARITALGG